MMRSMYSAVSGLRIHQNKMDTIGNNIANVNTVGFKKGQVTFQEVFSQVIKGASAPGSGKGGTNPQQVGMGSSTGSINTIHTQGTGQRTDNPTDLMIDGEGFFVVSDDSSFNNRYYTRAGNLTLDRDGNLTTADGYKVLGYKAVDGVITGDISNISINKSETKAPTATEKIVFKGNLDSRAEIGKKQRVDTVITDSLGNAYTLSFDMEKTAKQTWSATVNKITDNTNGNYVVNPSGFNGGNALELIFDDNGDLTSIGGNNINATPIVPLKTLLEIPTDLAFNLDKEGKILATPTTPGGTFKPITVFDTEDDTTFKSLSQYANEMGIKPYAMDGNNSGTLEGFAIDATGTITGVFTNGEKKALGQIMLAKFDNPMGLQKIGGSFFLDTRNSGEAQLGTGSTGGYGAINSQNLEMSNVDISLEFTEMITTQRGFQANSRIITTSDEMLQELVNMKR